MFFKLRIILEVRRILFLKLKSINKYFVIFKFLEIMGLKKF